MREVPPPPGAVAPASIVLLLVALLVPAAAGAAAPAGSDDGPQRHGHTHRYGMLLLDRLEHGSSGDGDSVLWDAEAWYGGDYRKLWITTEGHGPSGQSPEVAELQALYDRTFSPFFSTQAGVRYDVRTHGAPDLAYATVGVQGLAPQWFETDVALFLSEDGDLSLRAEAEYELRLTQRLILAPRVEVNLNADDVPELRLGSGVTHSELGLRLRYEIRRELAPYLGVRWDRLYGETRDLARSVDEPSSTTSFVIGIRAWF